MKNKVPDKLNNKQKRVWEDTCVGVSKVLELHNIKSPILYLDMVTEVYCRRMNGKID